MRHEVSEPRLSRSTAGLEGNARPYRDLDRRLVDSSALEPTTVDEAFAHDLLSNGPHVVRAPRRDARRDSQLNGAAVAILLLRRAQPASR